MVSTHIGSCWTLLSIGFLDEYETICQQNYVNDREKVSVLSD